MSLFDRFYRVKLQCDALEKVASDDVRRARDAAKVAVWDRAKSAVAEDPEGPFVGLMKAALEVWSDARASGVKTAAAIDDALPFVASFASAYAVDQAAAKMAAAGEITAEEHRKLAHLNGLAAFDDLEKIAFGLGDLLALAKAHPQVSGMMVGAAIGAGVGALNDAEDPKRGAVAGATLGTAVGALGGQVSHDWMAPKVLRPLK